MGKSLDLWDQLDNESGRQYEGFKIYLYMDPRERSLLAAWRIYSNSATSKSVTKYFKDWADSFAWYERALAYDRYVEGLRRKGMHKAIEKEAEKQGVQVEEIRNRMNEMMTVAYDKALAWLEEADFKNLRAQDVINIIKLHLEASKEFGGGTGPPPEAEWTEADDEEFADSVVGEIEQADEAGETPPDAFGQEGAGA